MAELLELITDSELTNSVTPWVAPQSALQELQHATIDGQPVLQSINYLPSRQSKLYKKFSQLTPKEQDFLREIVSNEGHGIVDLPIDEHSKIRIIDTLLDYYRVINPEIENNLPYKRIIQQRFLLPKGKPKFSLADNNTPHLGHKPSYSSLGYKSSSQGSRTVLRMRPVYYDQLDSGFGHIKGSSLSMLDTVVSTNGNKTEIEKLDLLLIESLYGFSTKLPGDNKWAWNLRIGAEKADNECDDCLNFIAQAGRGYAKAIFNDQVLINGMMNVGFSGESDSSDALFAEATIGINSYVDENWNVLIQLSQKEFYNTGRKTNTYRFTARRQLNSDLDIRLTLDKREITAMTVSMGFYW